MRKIYNLKNKDGIIPDKTEIAINIPLFVIDRKVNLYKLVKTLEKKLNFNNKKRIEINGVSYKVWVSSSGDGLHLSFYRVDLNGNRTYRQYFKLGKPRLKSVDGNDNFVLQDEIDKTGCTLYNFTTRILPEILYSEMTKSFCDLVRYVRQTVMPYTLGLTEPTEVTSKTFSFHLIEMSNNFEAIKYVTIDNYSEDHKEFDPNTDRNVLENINQLISELHEVDWVTRNNKPVPIQGSISTYKKGIRSVYFKMYEKGLNGHSYFKCIQGDCYDLFRTELKFTSRGHGGSDQISYFAKNNKDGPERKTFNSPDDIRRIFKQLASKTHDFTVSVYNVKIAPLHPDVKEKLVRKIIDKYFDYEDREEIVEQLGVKFLKINIKQLSSMAQKSIRELAKDKKIFIEAYKKQGDYYFDKELLGGKL